MLLNTTNFFLCLRMNGKIKSLWGQHIGKSENRICCRNTRIVETIRTSVQTEGSSQFYKLRTEYCFLFHHWNVASTSNYPSFLDSLRVNLRSTIGVHAFGGLVNKPLCDCVYL